MKTIFSAFLVLILTVVVNAHFQVHFPQPRGPFVEDNEPTFCDGFTNVTTNRTEFPLTGGFFTLVSEHPAWTAAFFLATGANPNSFSSFQQINTFFRASGEGTFCIPLDLSKSNATGLQAGQNVTIQMLFDGGDSPLYQCADVTLTSSNASLSSVQCTNSTTGASSTNSTGSGAPPAPSASGGASGSGALGAATFLDVKLLGLLGAASLVPLLL